MNRKLIAKWCAICLLLTLVLPDSAHAFAAEAGPAPASVSGNATVSGNGEGNTNPKFVTQTPVWGKSLTVELDRVENCSEFYRCAIYKDDQFYCSFKEIYGYVYKDLSKYILPTNLYIYDSGVYKVQVKALYYAGLPYEEGDWSEFSETYNYVRPSTSLGTTTAYWDSEQFGLIHFNSVKNAAGYVVRVYRKEGETVKCERTSRSSYFKVFDGSRFDEAGINYDWDVSSAMETAGEYYVTVEAISGDIEQWGNDGEGPASAVYDTTVTIASTNTNLQTIISSAASSSQALEAITAQNNVQQLQHAMHNNAETVSMIRQLEESYVAENNITVGSNVSAEASKYVDASKVSVIGAGLNASAGNVSLDISVPDDKVFVNSNQYSKPIYLDIKLKNDGTSVSDLKIPVTISFPVPAGIELNKLVLLHYNANGSYEVVNYKIENGMITFTVSHFSSFVLAEKGAAAVAPGSSSESSSEEETGSTTSEVITSPKTSDDSGTAFYFLLLAAAGFGILTLISGKKE